MFAECLTHRDRPRESWSTRVLGIASRRSVKKRDRRVSTGRDLCFCIPVRGILANLIGVTPEKAIKLAVNDFVREATADENGNVAWYNGILAGASWLFSPSLTSRCRFLPGNRHQPHGDYQDPHASPSDAPSRAAYRSPRRYVLCS